MKYISLYLLLILSYVLMGCTSENTEKATEAAKPNILFILVDDLGKEWVSAYGAQDIETPNIDQLATNGLLFENAYSMPQCTPSRLSFLTGQYPFRHGWVNHWDVPRWGGGCNYDWKHNASIAKVLQSAGYKSAAAGKWQVNDFRVTPDAMQQHGFDDFCMWTGYEGGNPPSGERYWNPYLYTKAGSKTYDGVFGPDVFVDFLIDFMKKNQDEPMFLYFPMCLTHTPLVTTPQDTTANTPLQKHKAMVRYTDYLLGKLVVALEELKIRDNTMIVFTTDNGTTRGITGNRQGRAIEGGKSLTLESGICEPFIVSGPGVPKGQTTQALTDFTDLFPTFAELAGADLPKDIVIDGVSIADVIQGKSKDGKREWMMAMGGKNRARLTEAGVENEYFYRDRVLRNKRYKLYIGTDRKAKKLVDLQVDPFEEKNILDSNNPEIQAAYELLWQAAQEFPQQDADPQYTPSPAQEWDVPITAKSQVWKIGHPAHQDDAILTPKN